MWPKLLIVATCLYIVTASVVPSIFDDEDTSNLAEVSRTARSCSFSGCNTFCRKLGHARGVCIGSYCQCRFRRRRSLEEETGFDNADADNENLPVSYDEDQTVNLLASDIYDATSDSDKDVLSEDVFNIPQEARSCGYEECNDFCRKLGYARGVCIGTYCQCRSRMGPLMPLDEESIFEGNDERRSLEVNEDESLEGSDHERVARAARTCGATECSNHCRKLGHARGVCIGTYCQCRSRLRRSIDLQEPIFEGNDEGRSLEVNEDESLEESDHEKFLRAARTCGATECNNHCRKMGYVRGVCIGTYCQCRSQLRRSIDLQGVEGENAVDAEAKTPAPSNENKFWGIFVVSGVQPKSSVADEENSSGSDGSVDESVRACNVLSCNKICRSLGFLRGVCIGSNCHCQDFLSPPRVSEHGAEDHDVSPKNFAADEHEVRGAKLVKDCNLSWCEQNCRRIGFPGGACVNGRCKCDILRSVVPELLTTFDDSDNDITASKYVVGNEGARNARAAKEDCNLRWCEQNCRRIGFPGGACVNGRCKCDLL